MTYYTFHSEWIDDINGWQRPRTLELTQKAHAEFAGYSNVTKLGPLVPYRKRLTRKEWAMIAEDEREAA